MRRDFGLSGSGLVLGHAIGNRCVLRDSFAGGMQRDAGLLLADAVHRDALRNLLRVHSGLVPHRTGLRVDAGDERPDGDGGLDLGVLVSDLLHGVHDDRHLRLWLYVRVQVPGVRRYLRHRLPSG